MDCPQILMLDIDNEISKNLEDDDYFVYKGTIGKQIELELRYNGNVKCLLQHDYPTNFHEYDILILDLNNSGTVKYEKNDHKRLINKTTNDYYIQCDYPQTIFDPRPYSLSLLTQKIYDNLQKGFLMIVFCAEEEEIEYTFTSSNSYESQVISKETYSFFDKVPAHSNKHGKQTKVGDGDNEIYRFLKKYNEQFTYEIVFDKPKLYLKGEFVEDPDFLPLVYNRNDELVSFCLFPTEHSGVFFFPQLQDKKSFVLEFLQEIAPSLLPKLFPNILKNSWVNEDDYFLPNQEKLFTERKLLCEEYEQKIIDKDNEIQENGDKYKFLHGLLTATDQELVIATIEFFKWLGFDTAKDFDEVNIGTAKEEDIQIETPKGLLVFEVKGLGGTSKDSDCSQIGKIRFRRCEQRGKFDVFAHYIVNHQRHLPPLKRKHPPFTEHQISDAKNEQRGLLTTWQLFNLYFSIENKAISKEQIRECFYTSGKLNFIPKEYFFIGTPTEFFKKNLVIILEIPSSTTLKVNEELFIEIKGRFTRAKIQSLRVSEQAVSFVSGCAAGISLNIPIEKGSMIYKI
jgi:hypothetical protein